MAGIGCILKVVPTGAPAGLDVGCERSEGTKGACSDFGLRSWKDGAAIA